MFWPDAVIMKKNDKTELVLAVYIKPFFWIERNAQITRTKFASYLLNLELDCKHKLIGIESSVKSKR